MADFSMLALQLALAKKAAEPEPEEALGIRPVLDRLDQIAAVLEQNTAFAQRTSKMPRHTGGGL